jgi:hypothetical protein
MVGFQENSTLSRGHAGSTASPTAPPRTPKKPPRGARPGKAGQPADPWNKARSWSRSVRPPRGSYCGGWPRGCPRPASRRTRRRRSAAWTGGRRLYPDGRPWRGTQKGELALFTSAPPWYNNHVHSWITSQGAVAPAPQRVPTQAPHPMGDPTGGQSFRLRDDRASKGRPAWANRCWNAALCACPGRSFLAIVEKSQRRRPGSPRRDPLSSALAPTLLT